MLLSNCFPPPAQGYSGKQDSMSPGGLELAVNSVSLCWFPVPVHRGTSSKHDKGLGTEFDGSNFVGQLVFC